MRHPALELSGLWVGLCLEMEVLKWKPLEEFLINLLLWLCGVLVVAHRIFHYSTWILWLWSLGSVVTLGRLSCFKACGILVPWPGIEPTSPALQSRFLTTGPPGKSLKELNPRNDVVLDLPCLGLLTCIICCLTEGELWTVTFLASTRQELQL